MLADFKNETSGIYDLIKKKESKFGNIFTSKYFDKTHSSELFSMRAEILRKIDDYKRSQKNNTIAKRD